MSGSFDIDSLLTGTQSCNALSKRIAATLIAVASNRVFSNPFRALLEIPLNSIDSYREMEAFESGYKLGEG